MQQSLRVRQAQLHAGAFPPTKARPNSLLGLYQPAQEMRQQCPMHPTGLHHPLSMSIRPASPPTSTNLPLTQPNNLPFTVEHLQAALLYFKGNKASGPSHLP